MNAADIMTRKVITAAPDSTVDELAKLMLDNQISGLPVVQYGAVLGIVSEGDLVRRAAADAVRPPTGWLSFFASSGTLAADYVRSHGRRARDLMSAPAVSVPEDMPLPEVAALMEQRRLKRVPVLDADGMLVGLITRSNLLRAFASQAERERPERADDAAIRVALLAELERQAWAGTPDPADIIVEEGVVHLWGHVRDPQIRRALVVAAESIPGVRAVADHFDTTTDIDPLDRPNWPAPNPP